MKSLPGTGRDLAPVGDGWIVGRQQHEDFGLQRIGVLKFVDEDTLEARLKASPDTLVVANQIPRLEQQVEKIERACLCSSPASNSATQLQAPGAEARRGRHSHRVSKAASALIRSRAPATRLRATRPCDRACRFPSRVLEIAIAAELDERRFEPIVVAPDDRFGPMQVVAELTGRPAVVKEVVVRIGGIRQQLDEVGQLHDERVDARTTIEWLARSTRPRNRATG